MWPPAARWACVPNTEPGDLIIPPRRSLRTFVHSGEELCSPAALCLHFPEIWEGMGAAAESGSGNGSVSQLLVQADGVKGWLEISLRSLTVRLSLQRKPLKAGTGG